MIAGCSSGIEPVYSLVYEKNVKVGSFYYVDPVFEKVMTSQGLYDEELIRDISGAGGTVQAINYIPSNIKRAFVTAMDVNPEDHIRALAGFQKWVDSSISKTNNFPADATVDDMRESYLLAYKLGCKDVTVFRDTSIKGQVLVTPGKTQSSENPTSTSKTTERNTDLRNRDEAAPAGHGDWRSHSQPGFSELLYGKRTERRETQLLPTMLRIRCLPRRMLHLPRMRLGRMQLASHEI